jgi:hypothetical protein
VRELRRIDRINPTLLQRHVWRELVFDVLLDLAPIGHVLLMLVERFGEHMPARSPNFRTISIPGFKATTRKG